MQSIAAVLVVAFAIDGGSVLLTTIAAPDDLEEAGFKAAAVVSHSKDPVPTSTTAVAALEAARAEAGKHDITVREDDFTIYADDTVELTGATTAPTLLFKHVPFLEGLAEVVTTLSVEPRAIDSSRQRSGRNR
ncbi:hypothetical protein [Nocardioides ochotonae]|uniref:hypothetical protein n=1 Tax=Nocardioides ochotonae TaxID=2685869 RepID=UPI001409C180|nr:hypothetical protein [Nocardioides ochotonae]